MSWADYTADRCLRFESACDSADELARLYGPYFDGTSLLLFTHDVRKVRVRVLVELVLSTGQCVLRGIADSVTETDAEALVLPVQWWWRQRWLAVGAWPCCSERWRCCAEPR